MAKAILEFDLSDPDDDALFNRAAKATNAYIAMHNFDQYLRNSIKYSDLSVEELETYTIIRENFHDTLESAGINLDKDLP